METSTPAKIMVSKTAIKPRKRSWARKRRVPKVGALGEILAHSACQIIRSHLVGDEKFFYFLVMRHSDASRTRFKAPTFGVWTFVIQLRFLG